ncbi:MAG: pyridoxamine 5'-phosphate oxidase family protein [Alphaproteobacteria bacterium]|nr:pyridoxamine 5'-phosphate oxidase family protein [Alphaproteobacteria bacterium]
MSQFFDHIPENLQEFISRQKLFFIATTAATGRISLSPKGMDTFRCLGAHRCAYLDLTGSGNETAAYLKADGRATIMFCSFDQQALILRLYGKGRPAQPGDPDWNSLTGKFPSLPGVRQIMLFDIDSVQTSCGYAVPEYELKRERPILTQWAEKKSPDELQAYRAMKNKVSIDGFDTGLAARPTENKKA